MADHSLIEWTDATWNPITGCTLVSEGCRHCYAATLAATRLKNHPSRSGIARGNAAGEAKFTGEVRFNEQQPLRWRRPRRIFVCAHGDLFHEAVPDAWIDRVFAVMALVPEHTFQVLMKRPGRALEYLTALEKPHREREIREAGRTVGAKLIDLADIGRRITALPLRNVWLGTVSRAPGKLDWVIVGGESGTGARPMHPDWSRSLRDQCAAAGVPFFFKQWSEWDPGEVMGPNVRLVDAATWFDGRWIVERVGRARESDHIDDEPDLFRCGKATAGRKLDGVEHNGMPGDA